MPGQETKRIVCHVDMNSYFASVEQQANPFLRGKPLGVCAYLHPFGCVIAASVEAKWRGMKVGMTVKEAAERVPDAIFVQNDPAKYRSVTARIFAIFDQVSDRVEHYSIDEVFLDLTGWYRDEAEAAFGLSRVKSRIKNEIGDWLRASVGIAPTRFLAKYASDRKKPDGLTIITEATLEDSLRNMPLEEACGIGPRIRRRLERLGIRTLLDLKNHPVENLLQAFGKEGYSLWCHMNGIECERVMASEALPKSIGHSYCVPKRVTQEGKVEAVLAKLTERAARRMRRHALLAEMVSVTVGCRDVDRYAGAGLRFPVPIDDSSTIIKAALELLHGYWDRVSTVSFLAITLSEFTEPSPQRRLSSDPDERLDVFRSPHERLRRVSRSVDAIRDRHGDDCIMPGSLFRLIGSDEAPDRIGFRSVTGVDITGSSAS